MAWAVHRAPARSRPVGQRLRLRSDRRGAGVRAVLARAGRRNRLWQPVTGNYLGPSGSVRVGRQNRMGEATQLSKASYDRAAAFLKSHRADQTPHVNSNLFAHLEATCELLREWGNAAPLCLAGLCHAVYGTDG